MPKKLVKQKLNGNKNAIEKEAQIAEQKRQAEIERLASLRTTTDLVNDFFAAYEDMLDELNAQPTTDDQIHACYNLSESLDNELHKQQWELHCQIQKVELQPGNVPGSQRLYSVLHIVPDEVTAIPYGWDIITKVSDLPLLNLSKQQVFAGDYITYIGTPRFTVQEINDENSEDTNAASAADVQPVSTKLSSINCFDSGIEIGGKKFHYSLSLTDLRFQFLKSEAIAVIQRAANAKTVAVSDPAILANLASAALPASGNTSSTSPTQVDVVVVNNPYPQYSNLWWVWKHEHEYHHEHHEWAEQHADQGNAASNSGPAVAKNNFRTALANNTANTATSSNSNSLRKQRVRLLCVFCRLYIQQYRK